MQARYYDPAIGRFLSIDPVNISENGNPIYFNRYAYVGNDPINAWDPDGRKIRLSGNEEDVQEFVQLASEMTQTNLSVTEGSLSAEWPGTLPQTSLQQDMFRAINSSETIEMDIVNADPSVIGDLFDTNQVDVADLNAFYENDQDPGAAVLTHIIEEKMYAVSNGVGYEPSHESAKKREAAVFGASTRTESIKASPDGAIVTFEYRGPKGRIVTTRDFTINRSGDIK